MTRSMSLIAALLVAACGGDSAGDMCVNAECDDRSPFTTVSAGQTHTCGLRASGRIECWGDDEGTGKTLPPGGAFVDVAAGEGHTCGLLESGEVKCWGLDDRGQATPPSGQFSAISTGPTNTCGVAISGAPECWGDDRSGVVDAPVVQLDDISTGRRHACGVHLNGSLRCWGDEHAPLPTESGFTQVSAASISSCALLDGIPICWGQPAEEPAPGVFAQIDAGMFHYCGVRPDGLINCWGGDNLNGERTPSPGTFESVSAGYSHSCAVAMDGRLECWGNNTYGQSSPPSVAAAATL